MQSSFLEQTVAEIVRSNYRTAGVFKTNGINYCCGGAVLLTEACAAKGLPVEDLLTQLEKAVQTISLPANLQYNKWKLDFLMEYIINVHHAYLKETLPKLEAGLLGFVSSHQKKMPYLQDILEAFQDLSAVLQEQMQQEEEVVFPYIKQLETAHRHNESYGTLLVKTLRKPLQQTNVNALSQGLSSLRNLTNQYRFEQNACTNHRVIYQQLQELDNDLVQHKHLENNILFPRAAETERMLLQGANIA
jgi:regulator of cell morphogenesis and NO signaling